MTSAFGGQYSIRLSWVLSLPYALRFLLATDPDGLTRVLGVVYRSISRYLVSKASLTHATGATGAVPLVQRFGSALNLNMHFHMLFMGGVYVNTDADPPAFRPVAGPDANELKRRLEQIAARVWPLTRLALVSACLDIS